MDWSHFRKEPNRFALKRLPTIGKPVRIKDVTDLDDYRSDFRSLSFSEGVDWYQRWIDFYELETETFDEAANRAPASFLGEMAHFKGHMGEACLLLEDPEPNELGLSAPAIKKAQLAGLIKGDADNGYQAGPNLASEFTSLIKRMFEGTHEATRDMPEPYQEAVWHQLLLWDGLPRPLAREVVRLCGGPIGQRLAEEAESYADSYMPGSEYGPPHFEPPLELHFRYQGSKDSYPKQRRVAVHHIVGVHQLYLKGRCLDSNEERSFLGQHIDGEILNTQTGELVSVDEGSTSQQLREALRAQRTTDASSGVAPQTKRAGASGAPAHTPSAYERPANPGRKLFTPWYRRPGTWGMIISIIILWAMFR